MCVAITKRTIFTKLDIKDIIKALYTIIYTFTACPEVYSARFDALVMSKIVAAVGEGVVRMPCLIQRMFPTVNTHCRGHNTTTRSATMSKVKRVNLFQSAILPSRPKVRRLVWAGAAVLLAPMSMQMQ